MPPAQGPWKSKGGRRYTTTRTGRLLSYHNAPLYPLISSASTEPLRIGAKILHSESQLILHLAREIPLQMWKLTQSLKSHPRTYRTFYQTTNVQYGSSRKLRCSNTKRNSKIFQKIFNTSMLPMTLDLPEMSLLDNLMLQITTSSWQDLAVQTHVESTFPPFGGLRTIPKKSRRWWRDSYDIKVILEKTMEQLNVDCCYLCFIPTALQWRSGRSKHGWDAERKEAIRTYFSVA